ncbi:glutaminyl-peptide cyclotransferase [Streptomyces sp. AC555_RSS877]|uniref:glutaminyl-peptide cyclotransferase n=1 Tax=Streptomyces sp. AC555_RSS877 TaxID=2823688 RepID=UPI0027E3B81C|nr:glutaminyl-peptide cyclotransferase [Streptomyces sp. AC555_RSS877]
MSERLRFAVVAVLSVVLLASCAAEEAREHPASGVVAGARAAKGESVSSGGMEQLRVMVLEVLPHDPQAFTQGLEVAGGTLYESTGLVGRSSVRAGPTGGHPTVQRALLAPLFGEGITVVGRKLWQLTWRNRIAIERDARTLSEVRRVPYPDEGWGVCHQRSRNRLVTSNGSSRLTYRDPRTLARRGDINVTQGGRPVTKLNELECVGEAVYANVLFTDRIVRIDSATGAVTASIDASGLLRKDERVHGSALNGIAAVPGTDQFLVTGKLWPKTFRVAFVPAGRTGGSEG